MSTRHTPNLSAHRQTVNLSGDDLDRAAESDEMEQRIQEHNALTLRMAKATGMPVAVAEVVHAGLSMKEFGR